MEHFRRKKKNDEQVEEEKLILQRKKELNGQNHTNKGLFPSIQGTTKFYLFLLLLLSTLYVLLLYPASLQFPFSFAVSSPTSSQVEGYASFSVSKTEVSSNSSTAGINKKKERNYINLLSIPKQDILMTKET